MTKSSTEISTQELQDIAIALVAEEEDVAATEQYTAYLQRQVASQVPPSSTLHLPEGQALAFQEAATCAEDHLRTLRFVRAIVLAIRDLLKKRPHIHVVYAGSGPLATLLLPAMATFSSSALQVTLLEAHPASAAHAEQLIQRVGLADRLRAVHTVDATQWQLPKGQVMDLLVSETMTAGLRAEPQVAITHNLMSQAAPHTQLIPERITLSVGVVLPSSLEVLTSPVPVFNLHRKALRPIGTRFPAVGVAIPPGAHQPTSMLALFTEIHLYGPYHLKGADTGLTSPLFLEPLPTHPQPGEYSFAYQLGEHPALHWTWLPSTSAQHNEA